MIHEEFGAIDNGQAVVVYDGGTVLPREAVDVLKFDKVLAVQGVVSLEVASAMQVLMVLLAIV